MPEVEVPVLIVGGGGCGLSASSFLSDMGVEHLLIERHPTTSHLPKAHYLNQRTMEILRDHDMADAIYEVSAPLQNISRIRWLTTLGGEGPLDGKELFRMDCFGGGSLKDRYDRDSPCPSTNHPQIRLEPILRRLAEDRAPQRVRFNHELVEWDQQDEGVVATVCDRSTDERYVVHARYVIGADGGKTIGPRLGVEMEGPTRMVDLVSVHFSADLSKWVDDETLIHWFINPENDVNLVAALVKMGPTWDRHSEEWGMGWGVHPDDPARDDDEAVVPRMRQVLKLPDLQPTVHKVSHWILDRVVAERFRIGNIFLAGDAVHRQPPTTGLGLNSAIQDVHNLCWKLAAVISGTAGDALLDTYDAERRPIGVYNADWALLSFANNHVINAAVGLTPGAPVEVNSAALQLFLSDAPIARTLRARAAIVIDSQGVEFQAHDVEIGFHYEDGAIVGDGTEPPERDPLGREHVPTTRPGHRLPHAWLDRGGTPVSTHDLTGHGRFTLLTGAAGQPWIEAAKAVSEDLGIAIESHAIGAGCELIDADGRWTELCGIDQDGVLLVRPDQHTAWRVPRRIEDPASALRNVLAGILSIKASTPV